MNEFEQRLTRNGLKRIPDGIVFSHDTFERCNYMSVPIFIHNTYSCPEDIVGTALLENRYDGIYAKCTFSDSERGRFAKKLLLDRAGFYLSFTAVHIKRDGDNIKSGLIRAVHVTPTYVGYKYEGGI